MMMPMLRYLSTTLTNNLRKDDPLWQGKKKDLNDNFAYASSHNEKVQDFQFICSTKGTQTETSIFSSVYIKTECQFQLVFAAPCNIKDLSNVHFPVLV